MAIPEELTDSALIALVKEGSGKAFEKLMKRHNAELARYIRSQVACRDDASDILQDTWVDAYKYIYKGSYREDKPLINWLVTMAKHFIFHFRNRQRKFMPLTDDHVPQADDSPDIHEEKRGLMMHLIYTLDKLPRIIVRLRIERKFSFDRIGKESVCPLATCG